MLEGFEFAICKPSFLVRAIPQMKNDSLVVDKRDGKITSGIGEVVAYFRRK